MVPEDEVDNKDEKSELEERRQAELAFVSSAYSEEEAWWSNDDGLVHVYRRLALLQNDNSHHQASVVLQLTLSPTYPAHQALQIAFSVEEDRSNRQLSKTAYNAMPKLVAELQSLANEMVGDECVFAIFSRADEWVLEQWPDFCQSINDSAITNRSSNNVSSKDTTTKNSKNKIVLGRRLIYSHHIISKIKRGNMKDLASHYQLTGYVKIGWPGLIIIEGLEEHCQQFYDEIKVWAWKYLVVRGEQQEIVKAGETVDSLRRFTSFQEVDNMSLVADHCRQVGLEALFRTSMKVYDNNDNGDTLANDGVVSGENIHPYGALVLVDHMNDGKNYRKWLRKTANDTGVFLLIKQCFPNHDFTKRPIILVALVGQEKDNVADFMKRWRTSRVDVDSKGKACLERQMKILDEGMMTHDDFDMDAIDWDTANAEKCLNVDKEQLLALMEGFGDAGWLKATQSALSI